MNIQVMSPLWLLDGEEETLSLPSGNVLFRQGDQGRYMYILKYGEADIRVDGHLVEKARVGTILGEMTLINGIPRTATVVATEDCKLIAIDRRRLGELLQRIPGFSHYLKNIIRGRHHLEEVALDTLFETAGA